MKFLLVCLLVVSAVTASRNKRSIFGWPYILPSHGAVAVGPSTTGSVAVGPSTTGSVAIGPSTTGSVAVGPSTTGAVAVGPSHDGYVAVGPSSPGAVIAPGIIPPLWPYGVGHLGLHGFYG